MQMYQDAYFQNQTINKGLIEIGRNHCKKGGVANAYQLIKICPIRIGEKIYEMDIKNCRLIQPISIHRKYSINAKTYFFSYTVSLLEFE